MLLCLRSGPLITSTYAISALKRPNEPLRRNSRQLAKTSYFTYPYIVACGLKTSGTFKSKRNVDLFVVLSALRLGLRCLRNEWNALRLSVIGELLLDLRYFRNGHSSARSMTSGDLLLDLWYLRNLRVAGAPCLSGELLLELRYFRNVSCDADRSRKVKYCLDYRTSETKYTCDGKGRW